MTNRKKLLLLVVVPLLVIFFGIVISQIKKGNKVSVDQASNSSVLRDTPETTKQIESVKPPTKSIECEQLQSPVEPSLITSILYPGQYRGDHYKPHGGFRQDYPTSNALTVTAPMDAEVILGSRYIEGESQEIQYMFEFSNACGINYRLDHLKILSTKLQALAETLPDAKVNDSRTTVFKETEPVTVGEILATEVGLTSKPGGGLNVFFDFGVYDRRQSNEISKDPIWAAKHEAEKELTYYAVCWLDLLPSPEKEIIKGLPGDNTSDYCN